MLILPIGREGAAGHRAWVTYTIVGLNLVFYLLFSAPSTDRERSELLRTWRATISYVEDRPHLRVPPYIAHLMPRHLRERVVRPDPALEDWQIAKEQTTLREMAAELRKLHSEVADVRMAYIPAVGTPYTILTAMFLHGGVLHLIGNMIFLLAVAPFIEEAYGKLLFATLYLSGGIVATLAFAARSPNLVVPLVGASGAIAAVMGAYLVRFARSRLEFLFIPVIFLPMWHFRFAVPALVALPIWFLEQIVSIPTEGASGVAVTAHVAGFAYGLVVATMLRFTRRHGKASASLAAPRDRPQADVVALRRALDLALFREEPQEIDAASARLLSAYSAAGDTVSARQLILEIEPLTRRQRLPQLLQLAASYAERTGDRPLAIALYRRFSESEAATTNIVPSLVKLAALLRSRGDVAGAKEALLQALQRPDCSAEWRQKIDHTLAVFHDGS